MNWDHYNEILQRRDSGHVEEAILELTKLGEGEKDVLGSAMILIAIANSFSLLRRFSDARINVKKACEVLGREHEYYPRAAFQDALLDMDEENPKEARKKLNTILENYMPVLEMEDHKDLLEEVRRIRGISLADLKRFREALTDLEAFRSESYERERTLYYIAACEFELGSMDAAKRDFGELLALGRPCVANGCALLPRADIPSKRKPSLSKGRI